MCGAAWRAGPARYRKNISMDVKGYYKTWTSSRCGDDDGVAVQEEEEEKGGEVSKTGYLGFHSRLLGVKTNLLRFPIPHLSERLGQEAH